MFKKAIFYCWSCQKSYRLETAYLTDMKTICEKCWKVIQYFSDKVAT